MMTADVADEVGANQPACASTRFGMIRNGIRRTKSSKKIEALRSTSSYRLPITRGPSPPAPLPHGGEGRYMRVLLEAELDPLARASCL
jgi:hypothetical protein